MEKKNLYDMCRELIKLQRQQYEIVKREIDGIINNRIRNEMYIERKLDEMLDILFLYENDDTLLTFRKLCRYYYGINPQATADYIMLYKEQNDPEGVKFGNKAKAADEKSYEEEVER